MSGESVDFEARCMAYVRPILAYVMAAVGRADDAEDLAQDVFARALEKRALFGGGDLQAWLYRMAKNRVAMYYRRRGMEHRRMASLAREISADPPAGTVPDDALVREELRLALRDAVAGLSEIEREAVRLKFAEGSCNTWIAGTLEVTPGNLGVILHRALRKLRAELAQQGYSWH